MPPVIVKNRGRYPPNRGRRPRLKLYIREGYSDFLKNSSQTAATGVFILVLIAGLYFGSYLMLPLVAGVILGMTFGPVVDLFVRRGLPAPLTSAILMAIGFGCVGALLYGLALPLEQWSTRLPEMWDEVRGELSQFQKPLKNIKEMEEAVEQAVGNEGENVEVTVKPTGIVTSVVSAAPSAIAQFVIFAGSLYFFLAYRQDLRNSILRLCLNQRYRLRAARIFRDVEQFLSRYILSIAAINVGFGLVVGMAMYLVGTPSPHLWGAMAGILNFVPYLGPAFMTLVLLGVGIAEFDGFFNSTLPALTFVTLNFIESQFVTPTVLGRTLRLNPFLIFTALTFWMWLWGPIGGFLAVPILLIVLVAVFRTTMNVAPGSLAEGARTAASEDEQEPEVSPAEPVAVPEMRTTSDSVSADVLVDISEAEPEVPTRG